MLAPLRVMARRVSRMVLVALLCALFLSPTTAQSSWTQLAPIPIAGDFGGGGVVGNQFYYIDASDMHCFDVDLVSVLEKQRIAQWLEGYGDTEPLTVEQIARKLRRDIKTIRKAVAQHRAKDLSVGGYTQVGRNRLGQFSSLSRTQTARIGSHHVFQGVVGASLRASMLAVAEKYKRLFRFVSTDSVQSDVFVKSAPLDSEAAQTLLRPVIDLVDCKAREFHSLRGESGGMPPHKRSETGAGRCFMVQYKAGSTCREHVLVPHVDENWHISVIVPFGVCPSDPCLFAQNGVAPAFVPVAFEVGDLLVMAAGTVHLLAPPATDRNVFIKFF